MRLRQFVIGSLLVFCATTCVTTNCVAVEQSQHVPSAVVSDAEPYLGNWALKLPNGHAGWLTIGHQSDELTAELWTLGSSPRPLKDVTLENGRLIFVHRRAIGSAKYPGGPPSGGKVACRHVASVDGDSLKILMSRPKTDGSLEEVEFDGRRIAPLPPQPDLEKVKFGEPIPLLNGQDLTGWRLTNPEQKNGWKARDGELINDTPKESFDPYSHYGNLRTDREFMDFNLQLEFKVPVGGNSGIYLRGRYEVQVVDRESKMQGIRGVGAIFNRIAPSSMQGKVGGEWQKYDITLVDRHVTVVLNGVKIIDNQPIVGCTNGALEADDSLPGPIYLQGDHTAVRYRNLVIRPVIKNGNHGQVSLEEQQALDHLQERIARERKLIPEGVLIHRNLTYVKNGHARHQLDLYLPPDLEAEKAVPLVIWVHGGGWRKGTKDLFGRQAFLLEQGYAVAAINYRLSSHAIFPAQLHDCKAAVRYLRFHAKQFGIDPERIGVFGASAGGHLAALLGTTADADNLEGTLGTTDVSSRVQAVCDWFGPTDLMKTLSRPVEGRMADGTIVNKPSRYMLLGGPRSKHQDKARLASPVNHVSADDPPFLIMHGDQDPIVPLEQSEMLHERLQSVHVESELIVIPGAKHGFFQDSKCHQDVIDFFDKYLK